METVPLKHAENSDRTTKGYSALTTQENSAVVDMTGRPDEEVTTEGFVLDVLEGEDDASKPEVNSVEIPAQSAGPQLSDGPQLNEAARKSEVPPATERSRLNEDRPPEGPPTDEELARMDEAPTKFENIATWCFIVGLVFTVIGVIIWHFNSSQKY